MILGDPNVKSIFGEIGNVAGQRGGVVMHRLAHQNPSHVRPPLAINRRMRIALLIRKLMMDAVCGHPENRTALERQCGADRQKILNPFVGLESAVRQ